jgi:hypothetical protein
MPGVTLSRHTKGWEVALFDRRKLIRAGAVGIVAGWALVGGPVQAQALNGLQRFEKLLPALKDGLQKNGQTLSYGSSSALGPSGFTLGDVVIDLPADPAKPGSKPSKATIKSVKVEDFDFDHLDLDNPAASQSGPYFMKVSVQGLAVNGGLLEQMSAVGLPASSLDLALDYRYEEARKVLQLNRFEITLQGLARLELSMILDGVPPPNMAGAQAAATETKLRTATLTFDDKSLLKTIVPIAALISGTPVDDGVAMITGMGSTMAAGQSPASVANIDALLSFARDWKAPAGTLQIALLPPASVSMADVQAVNSPDAAQKILGLKVTYAGTTPGISAGTRPAPAPQAAAGGLCVANGRVFTKDDDGVFAAGTVVEATGSGRCVVRPDGGSSNDDKVVAQTDLRPWSIDGPGTAVTSCKPGQSVLALSDGEWNPAKVKGSKPGGQCEVAIEGDDDTSMLPLASIRLSSD